MLGRRELGAAVTAALLAGAAVFIAGVEANETVVVRVVGRPAMAPEPAVASNSGFRIEEMRH
jgi:hypothetical protein